MPKVYLIKPPLLEQAQLQQLLQKLAKGNLSAEEKQALQALPPETLFPETEWEAAAHHAPPVNTLAAWRKISAVIWPRKPLLRPLLAASCMVGIIVITVLLLRKPEHTALTTISTKAGQRVQVKLPDGSTLSLNGNSSISYPAGFQKREVNIITGEAFFDVQQNAAHPFKVQAGRLNIRVLGTSFAVFHRQQQARVAVKTGKVAANGTVILPGRQFSLTNTPGESACDANLVGSWQYDQLVFEDAGLQEILEELRHNYGMQYKIDNQALLNKRFRASFKQRKVEDMLRTLASIGHFTYTIKDSLITIH